MADSMPDVGPRRGVMLATPRAAPVGRPPAPGIQPIDLHRQRTCRESREWTVRSGFTWKKGGRGVRAHERGVDQRKARTSKRTGLAADVVANACPRWSPVSPIGVTGAVRLSARPCGRCSEVRLLELDLLRGRRREVVLDLLQAERLASVEREDCASTRWVTVRCR